MYLENWLLLRSSFKKIFALGLKDVRGGIKVEKCVDPDLDPVCYVHQGYFEIRERKLQIAKVEDREG